MGGADVFEDVVALVTGANRGLGREIARQLAHRGATVWLGSRDRQAGDAAAAVIAREDLRVTVVHLDVTDPATVRGAAARLRDEHGRLDVLVNNAGTMADVSALATTAADMRETFETNVFGVVTVINELLPLLRHSVAARVVNVTSTTASLTMTSEGADFGGNADARLDYTASKAALNMLTLQYARMFSAEPSLSHVKINAATPGYVATDLNDYAGTRSVEEGARVILELASLPQDGPTGGFFNDRGRVPW
jgi:NAD(P)-dependent dehydrogenase (short-subunit alcohol dehydrogenase family)